MTWAFAGIGTPPGGLLIGAGGLAIAGQLRPAGGGTIGAMMLAIMAPPKERAPCDTVTVATPYANDARHCGTVAVDTPARQ